MAHTKPPFRVGRNKSCVVADDDTGLTIGGATGDEAVNYYGGNLVCESVSPDNAQFIVDACNFYWRILEIGATFKRPYRIRERKVEPTDAVKDLVRSFDGGTRYELVDGKDVYEVTAMQPSPHIPEHVLVQFFNDNSEWYDESPTLIRVALGKFVRV